MTNDFLTIEYLGQSGFRINNKDLTILIDPYLSDSVREMDSQDLVRLVDIPFRPNELKNINWVLITHDHIDHCDPKTLPLIYENNKGCNFLAPLKVCKILEAWGIDSKRISSAKKEFINLGNDIKVIPMLAAHPKITFGEDGEPNCIGWLMKNDSNAIYFAGDTFVCNDLINELKNFDNIDLGFLPVNEDNFFRRRRGIVGNMSVREAFGLASETGIKNVFPVHWDMFEVNGTIPEEIEIIYKSYKWPFKLIMGKKEVKL